VFARPSTRPPTPWRRSGIHPWRRRGIRIGCGLKLLPRHALQPLDVAVDAGQRDLDVAAVFHRLHVAALDLAIDLSVAAVEDL